MEVYIDILLLENLVINYIILTLTKKFLKIDATRIKLFLGSLIGAIYVILLISFPDMKIYYTFISKIILSFLITAIAFSPKNLKQFLKILAAFYISTFIFAGAAFAFLYLNSSEGFVKNGIFYILWDFKITALIWSIIALWIVLRIFWDVFQSKFSNSRKMISLEIVFEENTTLVSALIDTGSFLKDPITNSHVVVVEFSAIKEILPIEINNIFEDVEEDIIEITKKVSCSRWFNRFRIIPFNSLGTRNGLLLGFKPDYIKVKEECKNIKDVVVGVSRIALSSGGNYQALLSPELI